MDIIERLTAILESRRGSDPQASYVAKLYHDGLERILAKVAEESGETLVAAREHVPGRDAHLVHEVADLWFHTLVLLVHLDQKPAWVLEELERRFGTSGHVERASRPASRND
jgi:phosphoribosyl-ATP pyrophosphohydrolase